jgi:hypothetical protein
MIKPQLGEVFGSQLAGLKHHVETAKRSSSLKNFRLTRSSRSRLEKPSDLIFHFGQVASYRE